MPRAWASPSRTPGCSTRRSACSTETTQRAAELAVINEIGAALAQQLDFEAIIELVGERVGEIFRSSRCTSRLRRGGRADHVPVRDRGRRAARADPIPFGAGLTSEVIRSRTPLHLGTNDAITARGAISFGQPTESWLGVPILAGDRVLGVIALESFDRDAFDDGDERLLTTLASSMGVALENARLFDETKRLLAETDERAAELAIINERPAAASPRQLDMQAMYDLVGDKIQEIFDAQVVDIGISTATTRPHRVSLHDRAGRPVPRRADRRSAGLRRDGPRDARAAADHDDVRPSGARMRPPGVRSRASRPGRSCSRR